MLVKLLKVKNLKKMELAFHISIFCAGIICISLIFYNSLIPVLFFSPFIFVYIKHVDLMYKNKIENIILKEFSEILKLVKVNLNTGYSMENSIKKASAEISEVLGNKYYLKESLTSVVRKLEINESLNDALYEFASNVNIKDIQEYVEAVLIVKKSGGNLIMITDNTIFLITEKLDCKREIETYIAAKRYEFLVMLAMPFVIILYLRATFKGFLNVLYGNILGVIIMSVALVFIFIAYIIGSKIIKVEV